MAQVTLNPSKNAYIRNTTATTNAGNGNLYVGELNSQPADILRSLLQFSLSSIPSGSTITVATLRLYDAASPFSDNDRTMRAYRCLRVWVEMECTWNIYSTGNNWGTAGCSNTTTDREASDIGSVLTPGIEVEGWIEMTVTVAGVQGWLDGTLTNNGILLQMDTETDDLHNYNGRSEANPPQLVVTYTPPSGFFPFL